MKSKGFSGKKTSARLRRIKSRERYYKYTYGFSDKPHDDVEITCLNCGRKFMVAYKRREQKFCDLSCSTTHNNKNRDYSKNKLKKNKSNCSNE